MKTVITAFELMGMPPDTDPQAQNDVIDNSIQELGWIHLHLDDEFGNERYYLVKRKMYQPTGCDDMRELDPVADKDTMDELMELINHVDTQGEF